MKIIVVMPVKNEEWILEKSLKAISLFADHIIVADQNSTDRSVDICRQFKKVIVIKNPNKFHTSSVRLLLLNAARDFDGYNAIFSFDADEIPTTHILEPDFLEKLKELTPGSSFTFQWINLWRSSLKYRKDKSVWANSWKHFGFIDDRKADYNTLNVINDDTSRVPLSVLNNNFKFEFPKVLHYQFSNWDRTLSKQARYRIAEFIQRKKSLFNIIKINFKYFPTKDERSLVLEDIPREWINFYKEKGNDLENFPKSDFYWFDEEILQNFKQYKTEYFKWLDIWDIDWERKRQLTIEKDIKDLPENKIKDPRSFYIKFYHKHLQPLLSYNSFLYKTYRFLKRF